MTQGTLILTPPEPKPVRKRVRQTSIAAYAEARESLVGRKADVLRWLAAWWNRYQNSPTSAELSAWVTSVTMSRDAKLLYIRRGLSDLQKIGVVETVEKRPCRQTERTCHVWRVTQR